MHAHALCPENVRLATSASPHPGSRSPLSVTMPVSRRDNHALVPQASRAEWRHLAYVELILPSRAEAREMGAPDLECPGNDDWLLACMRVTERVERCPPHGALLDLGICTSDEACTALAALMARLAAAGLPARMGVAPGLALAQLARLRAPARTPLAFVTPADAPAFLGRVPVGILPRLHPSGAVTAEIVERLRRYGLRTLGHVARVGEPALRRQFGAAGAVLAALAAGRDLRPLLPTPPPERLRFRLRFPDTPATPERALLALPGFVAPVAAHLRLADRRVRELRLTVRWETGACERVRYTLRDHTGDARLLTDAVRRMLLTLLRRAGTGSCGRLLDDLRLTLLDLGPAIPEQRSFWRTDIQRATALASAADTLAHRYGHPILLQPRCVAPAAVLAEDRHRLVAAQSDGAAPFVSGPTPMPLPAPHQTPAPTARDAPDDAWRDVPLRLHWW